MACAHMIGAGFREVAAALEWLHGYSDWFWIEIHRTDFVNQCQHCLKFKEGQKVARAPAETVHSNRPREGGYFDSTMLAGVVL